jgi:hydroxymethylglutaryl-CoA reductase (NADPH)
MGTDLSRLREKLASGGLKLHELESYIFVHDYGSDPGKVREACGDAARIRCEFIEERTGAKLATVKEHRVDNAGFAHDALLPGIEMKIGAALIPMGVAGPVAIHGEHARGDYYVPLATNEAALIAGVQRGVKAINMAGGISTLVTFDGMSRAPLLEAPSIAAARDLCTRVRRDQGLLQKLRSCVKDPFVFLQSIEPYQLGTKVFLRLICRTGDAMGMNGVTKASADIVRSLLRRLPGWSLITISSNLCTDKKAAHVNVLHGRGKSVEAELTIPEEVLSRVFKKGVTSRSVERIVFHKCYLGSCYSGTLTGFNVNAANSIAAFFAATGQDLAQVVTSSSCFVQAEAVSGGLHFSVSLPCLELATVGGGTAYGTAREALTLLGCAGRGESVEDNTDVLRLAEICAAVVAALDLNTACSQAAGFEMADSHVAFARGERG